MSLRSRNSEAPPATIAEAAEAPLILASGTSSREFSDSAVRTRCNPCSGPVVRIAFAGQAPNSASTGGGIPKRRPSGQPVFRPFHPLLAVRRRESHGPFGHASAEQVKGFRTG